MHPATHASTDPEKCAMLFLPSGRSVTYAELDQRSNQGAQLFRSLGLMAGDTIALCLDSCPEFFEIVWAAQRSGLYYVTISNKLQPEEINYILTDSGARLYIIAAELGNIPQALRTSGLSTTAFVVGGSIEGYRDFVAERSVQPATPISDEEAGCDMLYSSGTTGRPKGIKPQIERCRPIDVADGTTSLLAQLYGLAPDSIYLCPAPLYHAAPLKWCMAAMRIGTTAVIMERFDPEAALAAIQRYRVTHAQFVPTHFIRMLKLPSEVRLSYDASSLHAVVHAAAPCPIPVKQAMLDWWGPVIHEYYSGSEGNGGTFIGPDEWLSHTGSVGRPRTCSIHICDEEGNELPTGSEGLIYFSGGPAFVYHNDEAKTAESRHAQGWTTLGDIGRVDDEGYLYLTDRKSFMIISGGVNIYPQEIENLLITHPSVADVAVVGAPDEEMGERVVAIVQPLDWANATNALRDELLAFTRASLSHVKAPRQIDFMRQLPRLDTGKLYKRLIRDSYWDKKSGAEVS